MSNAPTLSFAYPPRIGECLVAYPIARGMNTDVFAVWHTGLQTPLVCKRLRVEDTTDDARRERKWRDLLEREASALATLKHPGIVRLIADYTAQTEAYLLLEHLGGKTLRDRLREEKRLPVDEAVRIVQHLGGSLSYMHRRGFIHRDLKPSNIILRNARPVLLDFGVVWRWTREREIDLSDIGLMFETARRPPDRCGTPQYLAPEQVRREPLTPLTDVYGLGVLLFELITGSRPFPSSKATREKHLSLAARYPQIEAAMPNLIQLRAEISPALASVIEQAMHPVAGERFASVRLLQIALDNFTPLKIYPPEASAHEAFAD